jgi:tRNA U34 5-carboxymethylaminomethyl modifying GTPase MnmE/TrmE
LAHAETILRLGHITRRVDVEDLLDVVFADFCLGK